ncbi:tyrosine-protein phosphatase [Mycobacterium sp.]|uniref:tyrosine-protein phosphatase n=1 Tax=Mycobacterium sp. TaxID=1785 RepID=UPI003A898A20
MTEGFRELPGAWNFRDVADATAGLRPGRLFRSSDLSGLDDGGRAALRRLGITDVIDLRAAREVARRGPGAVPDGVEVHLLPLPDLGDETTDAGPGTGAGTDAVTDEEAPHETAFKRLLTESGSEESDEAIEANTVRYMTEEYREFPTRNGAQRAVLQTFSLLASGRSVLTHCFAGKDRTGFVVATVLEAIGVDRDAILADYLRSNAAAPQLRERITDMIAQRPDVGLTPEVVTFTKARLSDGVLGVRREYLESAWHAIDDSFGSLDGYLRDSGVTDSLVARLRQALRG